jgi:hypothetical protein
MLSTKTSDIWYPVSEVIIKVWLVPIVTAISPDGVMVPFCPAMAVIIKAAISNVAIAVLSAVIDKLQVPVPEQSPDHPIKVFPVSGVAVRIVLSP